MSYGANLRNPNNYSNCKELRDYTQSLVLRICNTWLRGATWVFTDNEVAECREGIITLEKLNKSQVIEERGRTHVPGCQGSVTGGCEVKEFSEVTTQFTRLASQPGLTHF